MSLARALRIALIAVVAVIAIVAGAGAVFVAQFDPNSLKPRIIAAVKRATGRDLLLNGKIGLALSLPPTIQAEDVAFSNPPGFSRPQMATLQSIELNLALLPLLSRRIEINRLVLIKPDILLETATNGQPNWQMSPEVSPTAPAGSEKPAGSQADTSGGKTAASVSVDTVRIQDGTVAYRDDATGKATTLGLPRLLATAASPNSPLHVDADARYQSTDFSLVADTGSLTRLQDPAATSPWPLKVALTVGSAKLTTDGSMTRPLQGRGYNLAIGGMVPDATVLTPLLQGFVPPPLHGVSFSANIADSGNKLPDVSSLTLQVGSSDLGSWVPGLILDKLDIAAPKADQPIKLDGAARLANLPVAVSGTLGPPALLMPGAKPTPLPVDIAAHAAGANASATGTIANASAMTGANIVLNAQIPDLSALAPVARHPLPAVKSVALQGTLTDANGGLRQGAALHGFSLTSLQGDLSGDAAVGFGPRKSLTAVLKSNRIDLDGLQALVDQMPAAGSSSAGPPPSAGSGSTPAPAPAQPAKRGERRLFSDRPIPLNLLRGADADVRLNIADLRSGGADYKAIDTHAVLSGGKLTVSPFAADLPGGHLTGTGLVDASQPTPPIHLVLHAPGLALKTVLATLNQPSYASGNLEVYADLDGVGDSPHAIAATLNGSVGLAMAGGTIDNRLLGSVLGKVMESLDALNLVGKGGNSELRCFGLRLDIRHGLAAINPLALNSSLLTLTGTGTANLGAETVALALRPQARVVGTELIIPIAVSGPIRDPSVKVNDLGAAEANAGTVAGVVLGNATPLGVIGGLFGADKLIGGGKTDICGSALAAARGQAAAASAQGQGAPAAAKPAQPSAPNPGAILKNLFR